MWMVFPPARRLAAALLCAACGAAPARGSATDASVVIERFAQSYVVDADGSYTLTVDDERSIVLERAVGAHGQYYISYNGTLDSVGQIEAYTAKPDGRRLAVGPGQILDQQEPAPADAPLFQDIRIKAVLFPDVAVGDRLVLHYVLRRAGALFPGQFEDLSSSQFVAHKAFSLRYDVPESMPLHADAVGFEAVALASPPGRRRYQWNYVPGENARIESESVSYLDYGKRLAVSSFADYAAFARAFDDGARGRAAVTPAIAELARQLTASRSDPRSKALALSDWVRRNIRYVAVHIGVGGVVPHPAATVLAQRYGDCKDHAVLLEALLAAAGIDSTGALVNSGNVFRLPRTPTLGIFNHIITYVPSLDLFLDPSADTVAAGYLPEPVMGKPVLLVKSGRVAATPASQPGRSRNAIIFHIGGKGETLFRVTKTSAGAAAEPYRQALRGIGQAERDTLVGRMLRGFGQRGYGVLDPGRLDGAGDEYQMVLAGVSENFANLPGQAGIATAFGFWGGVAEAVQAFAQEKERSQDYVCPAVDSEDDSIFDFAAGVEVRALPAGLALRQGELDYRADYARAGNKVRVRRRLVFSPAGMVCTPADFRRLRPLVERMLRDLKSQIIVEAR